LFYWSEVLSEISVCVTSVVSVEMWYVDNEVYINNNDNTTVIFIVLWQSHMREFTSVIWVKVSYCHAAGFS